MTLLVLSVLFIVACSREPVEYPDAIAADYPLVDGSTSTHPLSVLVACKIHRVSYRWERPPALERTVFPSGGNPLTTSRIENKVRHHGTHEAYMNLISGKAELIFVARAPSVREVESAREKHIEFEVKPIALDALVFVVNTRNPVNNLTLDQIRSIFGTQAVTKWSDVGGGDVVLEAFQREQDSGSQELVEKLVMQGVPIRGASEIPVIFTMAGVVNTVAIRENGLAYSIYYYVTNMAPNPEVKMIGVEAVEPSLKTIGSLEYPLTAEVFAVLRQGMKKEAPAVALRDWLTTDKGREAIRESGYVPIPPGNQGS